MTKRAPVGTARDTYHVMAPKDTQLAVKDAAQTALVRAQTLAYDGEPGLELRVERRTLFGPPVTLYRVVRDEEGVSTYPNEED